MFYFIFINLSNVLIFIYICHIGINMPGVGFHFYLCGHHDNRHQSHTQYTRRILVPIGLIEYKCNLIFFRTILMKGKKYFEALGIEYHRIKFIVNYMGVQFSRESD